MLGLGVSQNGDILKQRPEKPGVGAGFLLSAIRQIMWSMSSVNLQKLSHNSPAFDSYMAFLGLTPFHR